MAGIDLMPDRRRHLLLLFKEALTNITSHAQATRVCIKVRIERDVPLLKIADDGLGFAPSATKTGHGLASMSYRASELHATLDIASQPGRGTTVSVQAPL